MTERRSQSRCPVCQGPAVTDEAMTGGLKCRVSICPQNHQGEHCPRCQSEELGAVRFEAGSYEYTCRDCTNVWKKKVS